MFINDDYKMKDVRCLLCFCKQTSEITFKNVQDILCPGSIKPLKDVIQDIATSAERDVQISKETLICLECCKKVIKLEEKFMAYLDCDIRDDFQDYDIVINDNPHDNLHDEMSSDANNEEAKDCAVNENLHVEFDSDNEMKEEVENVNENENNDEKQKEEHDQFKDIDFNKKLKCDKCKFTVNNAIVLMLHKNVHKGLKDKQCPYCKKIFRKKGHCLQHMEIHMNVAQFKCEARFTRSSTLKNHKLKHDAEENPLYCKICQKQFISISTLRNHAIIHREDRPRYTCEHCGKNFTFKNSLKHHICIHINSNMNNSDNENGSMDVSQYNRFKCDLCDFTHEEENHLILHKNIHKGLKKTQCPFCQRIYNRKSYCLQHMETHIDSQKYQCDTCGLRFSQSSTFHYHKLKHDAEENPFFCKICQKQFISITTFRNHKVIHSEDRPRYNCERCGKVYIDKQSFKAHVGKYHTRHNPENQDGHNNLHEFICDICDYSHKDEDHVIVHKGVKETQCHYCDKLFGRKKSLLKAYEITYEKESYSNRR